MVSIGETAPDFTLEGTQNDEIREFSLSDFADSRPTVLVFYIHDFSPVCSTQMCEVNDMELLTFNDNVGVLGISTDGPYSHQKFIQENIISYPLLTDVNKEVYEAYGMTEEGKKEHRQPKRGIVLVDGERTVRYRWEADDNWDEWENEPLHEIHDLITELTSE